MKGETEVLNTETHSDQYQIHDCDLLREKEEKWKLSEVEI